MYVQWLFKEHEKNKSKLEWFKKNIVIVPVVAAIIAGTFTSVRYVLNLTDTITANQETIFKMESKITSSTADINDLKQRLSAAEQHVYGRKLIQTTSRHSKRSYL